MEDKEKQPRKRRKKKQSHKAYDEYVANVSNGMNPPSTAKRRRKKKIDTEAYDAYLEQTEPQAAQAEEEPKSRRSRRAEREAVQMKMDMDGSGTGAQEDYDSYLQREDSDESPRPRKKRARRRRSAVKKRRRKIIMAVEIAVLLAILAGYGALSYRQMQINEHFEEMRRVVEDQRFYEGTTVDGFDLSGMTLEEALTFFEESVEPQYRTRTAKLSTGEMYMAEQLGYESNYASVLRAAWSGGRTGTLEERYNAITGGELAAVSYPVTRTFYTEQAVKDLVAEIAAYTDQSHKEPQIKEFNLETWEFTLDDGQPGYKLNQEMLVSDICYVMDNGGGDVAAVINAVPVEIDSEKLYSSYGQISYLSTSAKGSEDNRLWNLNKACEALNGYVLQPGEEFSFNKVLGQRTKESGYKKAGVYVGGGNGGRDYGGGICQVASTLFNVAVMADMDVTERRPHSKPVSYLPKGQDATINWPDIDLKFVNVTEHPVYIVARLTEDKQVECAIYGRLPEDGHTVIIKSSTYKELKYETHTKIDESLAPGTYEVVQKGRTGYKAKAYKITLDKNGKQIKKEDLCYSTYKQQDEYVLYNP